MAVLLPPCAAAETVPSGLDPALATLEQRIRTGEIPNIHSVIAVRGGKTIIAWYFNGPDNMRGIPLGTVKFDPNIAHDVRSVSKTIVSMLFGIALARGAIKDIDAPVLDFFPEYLDLQTAERRRVTLRHLLTMTSGLHWDESTYPYSDRRNSEPAMDNAPDPLRFALEQDFDAAPGVEFRYSGGSVALIAEVIVRAVGRSLDEFAGAELFTPLSIRQYIWLKNPKGVPFAASGLRLLPTDMAKIGELMLRNGKYGTQQIVPEAWMKTSAAPHALVRADKECGQHYGYFVWVVPNCGASGSLGWIAAVGNGGQLILVVPERDLVVVVTAGLYDDPRQRSIRQIGAAIVESLPR